MTSATGQNVGSFCTKVAFVYTWELSSSDEIFEKHNDVYLAGHLLSRKSTIHITANIIR